MTCSSFTQNPHQGQQIIMYIFQKNADGHFHLQNLKS